MADRRRIVTKARRDLAGGGGACGGRQKAIECPPEASYTGKRVVGIRGPEGDPQMIPEETPIVMEEVTDPEEIAKARVQWEGFDRNSAWLQAHATEVFPRYRGKCICIAGEELFVADTPEEVLGLAAAAHPEDDGSFVHYIPREKVARISIRSNTRLP
jgi:hypothetical protein